MLRYLTLEYWKDDGWYVGRIKEVPGVFSQGETLSELEENVRDASLLSLFGCGCFRRTNCSDADVVPPHQATPSDLMCRLSRARCPGLLVGLIRFLRSTGIRSRSRRRCCSRA